MINPSFPNIDYIFWRSKYSWEDFSSMKAMISTLKNKNLISQDVIQENITEKIKDEILSYLDENNDETLFHIFKLIQTWGGKSSGNHTLKIINEWLLPNPNDLFETNCAKYKSFVHSIINIDPEKSFYSQTNTEPIIDLVTGKKLNTKILGLSYSFVPKHICFWSGKGERSEGLPILDDVIAKIVYKVSTASKVDYSTFISDMNDQALKINSSLTSSEILTATDIEMALFAFSGNYWDTRKTATKDLIRNPKIISDDINEAKKIADLFTSRNNSVEKKKNSKVKVFKLTKLDFIKNTSNIVYINDAFIQKNKKINTLIKPNSKITFKEKSYFEYKGEISQLVFL